MKRTIPLAFLLTLLGSFLASCTQTSRPRTSDAAYIGGFDDPVGNWNVTKAGNGARIRYDEAR